MGFWSSLFHRDDRKQNVWERWIDLVDGSVRSRSGRAVTWSEALKVTTMLACCRVIAEGCAQVPLRLLQESRDGRKRMPAKGHPLYTILGKRPNYWQTSFEYRELLLFHLVTTGNAYSYKSQYRGSIGELLPIEPRFVTAVRDDYGGVKHYRVTTEKGESKDFAPSEIWHLRGPSWDGWCGLDIAKQAREALGLALATEETHAAWHANGAKPSALISVDGPLKGEQYEQLQAWLAKSIGSRNSGVPLILDRAAKLYQQSMSGVDAQHLETRRFQVEEICRGARVMPIMVGYSDKAATYASAEQMFLAHVVHTLSPWYERIEGSIDVNLLSARDRADGIYSKFDERALLRGSLKDTKDTILGYVNGGIWTPNEGRTELDMDADDDPKSDRLRVPANVVGTPKQEETDVKQVLADISKLCATIIGSREQISVQVSPPHVTVNTPEVKAGDVRVEIADGAMRVLNTVEGTAVNTGDTNVAAPTVEVKAGGDRRVVSQKIERKDNGEIARVVELMADGSRLERYAKYSETGELVSLEVVH